MAAVTTKHVDSLDGNPFSGPDRDTIHAVPDRGVRLVPIRRRFAAGLHRFMIHDPLHREPGEQQRHVAEMVDVVMRDHPIIDLP